MPHKRFETQPRPEGLEPITFEIDDERFDAEPFIPGGVLLELATSLVVTNQYRQALGVQAFFREVLVLRGGCPDCKGSTKADAESADGTCETCGGTGNDDSGFVRFRAVTSDPNRGVHLLDVANIAAWLMAVYAERPTSRPSDSAPGPSSTEAGSEDAAP